MKGSGTAGDKADHDILTEKQCEVLDLLIEHKTSKEIARVLGISPHTVDQRISLARAKMGVSSRNELAARYQTMRGTPGESPSRTSARLEGAQLEAECESNVFGSSIVERNQDPIRYQAGQEDDDLITSSITAQASFPCPTDSKLDYRVGPEVFEGSSGGLWRLGAIVATALLLVMTILGLFAIFDQLNDLLA